MGLPKPVWRTAANKGCMGSSEDLSLELQGLLDASLVCQTPDRSFGAHQWIEPRLHQLKHDGPTALLAELHQLQAQHPQSPLIRENLTYLEKRVEQIQYPFFQQQGWPIGSGCVESANKLVVEVRLKGAGMHWQPVNVDPMLSLRNLVCSDRWTEDWPLIVARLRQQVTARRNVLRLKHRSPVALPLAA